MKTLKQRLIGIDEELKELVVLDDDMDVLYNNNFPIKEKIGYQKVLNMEVQS